ncbi:MAG: DUF4402 domain-containing protein [Sphingomicrobium sp.]
MTKLFRLTAAAVALVAGASPALAVNPDKNATGTVRIVKPLTLLWVQDLDLGTVLLSGTGAWSGAAVGITKAGVFTCPNANVTCSGATKVAKYKITGTNNADVIINTGNVTMVNANDNTKSLLLTVDSPGTVNLGNSGAAGYTFSLGGAISVDSTTTDGQYTGTFNVTVNY